jgi:crotonobetaine/carnitine-CoA ligase
MHWVREYGLDYVFLFEAVFKQPPHPEDGRNQLKLAVILALSKGNHAALEARFNTIARERFGMTEGAPLFYMPNDHAHMVGSGSCGIPAPFCEASIRDADGEPVAPGEVGEMWVRSPATIRGYYNQPQANAESFRNGWMRTGDLFQQDAEGYYYVVGRVKDMIRRSQENISAHELEAVLRAMPGVREAACVPVPDELRGEEVKAYLELEAGLTHEDVRPKAVVEHCERLVAQFKVPRYLEYVESFPYGPSQKVEKRKLVAAKPDLRVGSYDRMEGRWL